jgi:hypothetical protein
MVQSNQTLVDSTSDVGVIPEDRNFVNPIDDLELRRTNPKRYDARQDWTNSVNEHGHDSPYEFRYETTSISSSKNEYKNILRNNKMSTWRQALAKDNKEFKPYKEDGVELPNQATFTGDKEPSSGKSSDKELKAWKSDDKVGVADRKREKSNDFNSALMQSKIKQENVGTHMKSATLNWRQTFADFSLKKKNDGTLEVNITDVDTKQDENYSNNVGEQSQTQQEVPPTLNSMGSDSRVWTIAKKGSMVLKGIDSPKFATITITDGSEILLNHTVAKKGNSWREVIAQGRWETEFSNM